MPERIGATHARIGANGYPSDTDETARPGVTDQVFRQIHSRTRAWASGFFSRSSIGSFSAPSVTETIWLLS